MSFIQNKFAARSPSGINFEGYMSKLFSKIYFEITNVCNLNCSFCHGTKREKKFISFEDFATVADKLRGKCEFLYLHLLGEPLLHPEIERISAYAKELGFKVMLTTNGTLCKQRGQGILHNFHKVSISLHSFESNENSKSLEDYIGECCDFAKQCQSAGVICALRLWNENGKENEFNNKVLGIIREHFPTEWIKTRSGYKLNSSPKGTDEVYLEYGVSFEWPDKELAESDDEIFCYGLRSQVGILCDGTVVPCCLDADGSIPLGNIYNSSLEEIVSTPRARALYDSFTKHKPCEKLCRTCGYARVKHAR